MCLLHVMSAGALATSKTELLFAERQLMLRFRDIVKNYTTAPAGGHSGAAGASRTPRMDQVVADWIVGAGGYRWEPSSIRQFANPLLRKLQGQRTLQHRMWLPQRQTGLSARSRRRCWT